MTHPMTAPTHGAVLDAESVKLLRKGDRYLCKTWGPVQFDRFDDSERRAFVTNMAGQVRLMVPAGNRFLGRPDADGWITHDGGPNPVPGQMVDARFRKIGERFGYSSDGLAWDCIDAYRLARPTPVITAHGSDENVGLTLTPVGRPTPEPAFSVEKDYRAFHATLATPPAQPEPGAGELEDAPIHLDAFYQQGWHDCRTQAQAKIARLEKRIQEIAALFGVCDGGRYLNDWKARAEHFDRALRAEADAAKVRERLRGLEGERKRENVRLNHLKRAVAVAWADTLRDDAVQTERRA